MGWLLWLSSLLSLLLLLLLLLSLLLLWFLPLSLPFIAFWSQRCSVLWLLCLLRFCRASRLLCCCCLGQVLLLSWFFPMLLLCSSCCRPYLEHMIFIKSSVNQRAFQHPDRL